jgi:hypothetical protein
MANGQKSDPDFIPAQEQPDFIPATSTASTQTPPAQPSTWQRLKQGEGTRLYDPGAEQFAEKHPGMLGTGVRALSAFGGAVGNIIPTTLSSLYDAGKMMTGNTAPMQQDLQSVSDWFDPKTRPNWQQIKSVLPEALGVGAGSEVGGALTGEAARRIPEVPQSVAEATRVRTPRNPTGALKPAVRTTAQTLGAVGGAMSHGPYGAVAGYALAPKLLDMVLPNLEKAEPPTIYGPTRMNPSHIASVNPEALPSIGTTGAGQEPFEPLIYSSPEEAAQNDFRMANLKRQASAAGTYHAAQGAAGKRLNLQQRIGRKFIPKVSE